MLNIHLVWVERTKEPWLKKGIDFYISRLKHYLGVKVSEVRPRKKTGGMRPKETMRCEAEALLKVIPERAFVIAMDIRGKMMDSPGLAELLTKMEDMGTRELVMVIGGSMGLSPEVISRADLSLSLSSMTFTHDMTRLILLEQLYRACTIRAGQPYHH